MKILIASTFPFALDLPGTETAVYAPDQPFADEQLDADMLIAWQNTAANLQDAAARLTTLRLVQTLAAGPDAVLAAGFAPTVQIASGRSLHDETVAEHALALTLAAVRRLDQLLDAQHEARWDTEFVRDQAAPETESLYTLRDARVTIWGFGSIAAKLAPMLTALGAEVRGIAGSTGMRGGVEVVASAEMAPVLAATDVLISVLPFTPDTADAFDAERIGQLKPGAVFVNVGRGGTVDEAALIRALESGQLRFAALDVMKSEPLPSDSPLWRAPNILLTPHVAGNRPRGVEKLVRANVAALQNGSPIVNLVTRTG